MVARALNAAEIHRAHTEAHPETPSVRETYTAEELGWLKAVDAYRVRKGGRCMTCMEYLRLLKSMGYRQVGAP